jgi:hypothetical protein
MIEPAFGTPLVPAVGIPALLAACFRAAGGVAIALATITMRTDPEHCLASLAAANSLPENYFSMRFHPPTQADFDNGNDSCQRRNQLRWWPLYEGCRARTPPLPRRGSLPPSSHNTIFLRNVWMLMIDGLIAPSARMMSTVPLTPAKDSENYVF